MASKLDEVGAKQPAFFRFCHEGDRPHGAGPDKEDVILSELKSFQCPRCFCGYPLGLASQDPVIAEVTRNDERNAVFGTHRLLDQAVGRTGLHIAYLEDLNSAPVVMGAFSIHLMVLDDYACCLLIGHPGPPRPEFHCGGYFRNSDKGLAAEIE